MSYWRGVRAEEGLKKAAVMEERREVARWLRKIVDLYEQGDLTSFEWTDRVQKMVVREPSLLRARRTVTLYQQYGDHIRPSHRPYGNSTYTHYGAEYDMWYDVQDRHPLLTGLEVMLAVVNAAHSEYEGRRTTAWEEQRERQVVRDRYEGLPWKRVAKRGGVSVDYAQEIVRSFWIGCNTQQTERKRTELLRTTREPAGERRTGMKHHRYGARKKK